MTGIVILALALLATCWYGWTGYIRRYKKCRHCRGRGTEALGSGAAGKRSGSKTCRECKGYGRVLRMAAARRARRGGRRPARRRARKAVRR
jgi:hypothetical protein